MSTLYTESFVSLFLSFLFCDYFPLSLVSHETEETTNLCSISCFRKAKETKL